jgi:hypothetical protein
MMLMPANNTSGIVHYLAGKYPGKIGMLISPKYWKNPPYYIPYALDNGAFTGFNPDIFTQHINRPNRFHRPLWVAVPDAIADPEMTFRRWHKWNRIVAAHGFKLAFVAQDGMEPQDVPPEADCVFIGGTTDWKISNAYKFKDVAKLLHIGRVNTLGRLKWAEDIGADSVDGTGWFRGRDKKYYDMIEWFEQKQGKLFK